MKHLDYFRGNPNAIWHAISDEHHPGAEYDPQGFANVSHDMLAALERNDANAVMILVKDCLREYAESKTNPPNEDLFAGFLGLTTRCYGAES